MNCLKNLNRTPIPHDVFMQTLKLYYRMGRNKYYESLFENDFEYLSRSLSFQEALAFYRTFFSHYKIPESRLKTLQLASTVAKNKSEQLYKNIIAIFQMIHFDSSQPFHLTVTEINDLVKLLFKDVYPSEKLQYKKTDKQKHSLLQTESVSKREQLEELIIKLGELKKENRYETTFLYLNFCIDFLNMDIYKFEEDGIVAILIFYIMTMQEGLLASKYVPFFGKLLIRKQEFLEVLEKTKFGWSEGYSEMMPLQRYLLAHFIDMYQTLDEQARDYEYESKLEISKSDYIENTIDKLSEVFSKEDIRLRHPLISDSTINRTLKRLQEESKIRPLGKGRSAKWIKLYKKETKKIGTKQLNFFDLGE